MRHLALQSRGGASVDLGRCVFYTPAQGGRRKGFFSDPPPPPQTIPTSPHPCFGSLEKLVGQFGAPVAYTRPHPRHPLLEK